jgi:hypothetical protein
MTRIRLLAYAILDGILIRLDRVHHRTRTLTPPNIPRKAMRRVGRSRTACQGGRLGRANAELTVTDAPRPYTMTVVLVCRM